MTRSILRGTVSTLVTVVLLAAVVAAQRGAPQGHPHHPPPAATVRGHVFIGGYFYDPFFGPYPWWPRAAYGHWYAPVFDTRADVRLHVRPDEAKRAAVYVDGFYAGIVEDFDGVFQGLPLTPGGHRIVLYLEGYRTVTQHIYLGPGTSFQLRATLERLPVGEGSQPPDIAPPVPPPPAGTYRPPVTPPRTPEPPAPPVSELSEFGTLDLFVQPTSAEVTIDGRRWETSEAGHVVAQLPAGRHRIEVSVPGYEQLTMTVTISEGKALPIKITLPSAATERFSGGPRS